MPELESAVEETVIPDESQEPVSEDTETPDESQDKPEPEPEKEPEDDGFKQFLKDNELPDSFESPEEFAKAYKEVLSQFKREQTDRVPERRAEPTPQVQPQKSYFNTKAADELVKTMEDSGMFGGNEELAKSYKSIAKVIDNAYGAELSKAEQVMTSMFTEMSKLRDRVLGMEWNGVNPEVRKRVKRDEVDKLMQEHRFADYESAVRFYAMTKDPNVFKLLNQRPEENKNKNKQRVRWGARGGGQSNYDSQGFKQYMNLDGSVNDAKLPQGKVGYKILDEIIAYQSRNR